MRRGLRGRFAPGDATSAGYALLMALLGGVAAWPIYAGPAYVVVVAAAVIAAFAVAVASRLWGWSGWRIAAVSTGVFVVLGLALAVPTAWTDPAAAVGAVRDLAAGAVTGWKDLLTVDLPVGGYRNLLVPALLVFFAGPLAAVLIAWRRRDRRGSLAVVPALAMPLFGLLFGRTVTSDPLHLGAVTVAAPLELAVGAASLVVTLSWLSWRALEERRAALRRAADSSGVRVTRRRTASDARRLALAGGMLALAVVAAAAVAPALAADRTRDVLRSGTGPELALSQAVSPLSEYRAHFASDDAFTAALFRVSAAAGPLPDRIRLATLTAYDGSVYRVGDPVNPSDAGEFTRVPSLRAAAAGTESTVRIDVAGLSGIWLPTFGSLTQVQFAGADAASLGDAFYYDAATDSAVDTANGGLVAGDSYVLTATTAPAPALATLEAPGTDPAVAVPDSIRTWIEHQDAGTGGAALQTLIERLRARGYLSHALAVPAAGSAWTTALGEGYTFQPSASGHSLARVDEMFTRLLQRETDAAAEGADASLVAAIGDDEQFAVAASLIAEQLGFPSRVVVGVRLSSTDDTLATCDAGECTGGDVTAWVEVQSRDGAWVPVDVTPQHEAGIDTRVTRERDPEVPTDVRPEAAQEVVPPDPVQQDTSDQSTPDGGGLDLAVLWTTLRISASALLVLLIVGGPFAVVLVAKRMRRRSRRDAGTDAARIVGGWDEYVDAAVDHGLPVPAAETRAELAQKYATASGPTLAAVADRVVFSDAEPGADESAEFWRLVDDERRRFGERDSPWRRALAAVSLSSFTRGLAPRIARDRTQVPRRAERRGRRRGSDTR